MKRLVKLKIAVDSIDKARLFRGKEHVYLDAVVFLDDEPGKYGDNGVIKHDISKEERDAGQKGAILGNAKIVWTDGGEPRPQPANQVSHEPTGKPGDDYDTPEGDSIPF